METSDAYKRTAMNPTSFQATVKDSIWQRRTVERYSSTVQEICWRNTLSGPNVHRRTSFVTKLWD